jgi:hypothetical protein
LKNETQHLYNVIALGCASLNPTYEYNIKALLKKSGIIRVLYLAISQDIYQEFFTDSFIQTVLQTYEIKLLVFDINKEAIVLWKY